MKLTDLGPDVLACRSMGHAWFHLTDENHLSRRGDLRSFDRIESCERCGAHRRKTIDLQRGEVTKRSMRYPVDYLLKGQPRTTRFDALVAEYGFTAPRPHPTTDDQNDTTTKEQER